MGANERPPEGLIAYRLPASEANKRAVATALVRAASQLMPLVLAVVLLHRLGWAPTAAFWAVVGAIVVLVVVRAVAGWAAARRTLAKLVVSLTADDVRVEGVRDGWTIPRARIARMLEVGGALGGLRVESLPDPRSGTVFVADFPRGGAGFADVRARLETWGTVVRRGRRGPAVRVAIGVLVVVAIFFVPFLLEDVVARSRWIAAALVAGMWLVLRAALRVR
ncbi:MAG TPA: hypothetical protein VF765_35065 [Polyangiaceae bacterium]